MLCEVLGVGKKDHERVLNWTVQMTGADDPDFNATPAKAASAFREVFEFGRRAIDERRRRPTGDLVSVVANARFKGKLLDREHVDGFFALMIGAGNRHPANTARGTRRRWRWYRQLESRVEVSVKGIIVRTLIIALGIWVADKLVPGIDVASGGSLVFAAIALGLINALIRPLIVLLTLPFTLLTLGLFLLIVNAAMLQLADWFVSGFEVTGFFSAILGSIVVSLVSWAASSFIGPKGRYELMVRRERY